MSPATMQILMLGAALFVLGSVGFLTRRNVILMFLSLELMLAGVSMNFISFGYHYGVLGGQMMAILILTVASCEAALSLALIVALYRRHPTLDVAQWSQLGEVRSKVLVVPVSDTESNSDPKLDEYPDLAPAGPQPSESPAPPRIQNESLKSNQHHHA